MQLSYKFEIIHTLKLGRCDNPKKPILLKNLTGLKIISCLSNRTERERVCSSGNFLTPLQLLQEEFLGLQPRME